MHFRNYFEQTVQLPGVYVFYCRCSFLYNALLICIIFFLQVRSVDEMNHEFQALALESRGMGEVNISRWLKTLLED